MTRLLLYYARSFSFADHNSPRDGSPCADTLMEASLLSIAG